MYFSVSRFEVMKASRLLGVEDVTIKEISMSTVPQVLLSAIQLAMGGVCVCAVCALHALRAPHSKKQTDGSSLRLQVWLF